MDSPPPSGAERTVLRCPRCDGPLAVRPAEEDGVCPTCRSADAWTRYGAPGARLVVRPEDVAEALARRLPQAGAELPLRRLARRALCGGAVLLAAVAVAALARLASFQELVPLAELRQRALATSVVAAGAGLLAVAAGLAGAALVRRVPRLRSWGLTLTTLGGAAVGVLALLTLGLWSVAGQPGLGWAHQTMPAPAEALAASGVERSMAEATVVILAPDARGDASRLSIGAGTVVRSETDRAWIVTCSHVAMPYAAVASWRDAATAQPIWIYFADGRHGPGRVEWTAQPPLDVAVVSAALTDPPRPATVLPRSEVVHNEPVQFVPNPFREGWRVLSGRVLRTEPHVTPAGEYRLLFTDLPVQPGDSGTGLFDRQGRLVGINTWQGRDAAGRPLGISLPARAMRSLLDRLEGGMEREPALPLTPAGAGR